MASTTRRSRTSRPAIAKSSEARGEIVSFLQPIVSIREQEVRVVEALARRIDDGIVRTPSQLFAEAAAEGTQRELLYACRAAALTAYKKITEHTTKPPVLSLNMDSALVDLGAEGALQINREVSVSGVAPHMVALEILESAVPNATQLEAFCHEARKFGYLLALDDMGTGHSNLERIPRLQPDILKIDRALVQHISHSYHRQEVFRALMSLSHQIGALPIAEGVETEEDVATCLSLGCDLFQGYYFGRACNPAETTTFHDEAALKAAGVQLRVSATKRLQDRRRQHRRSEQAMRVLLAQLKDVAEAEFDNLLGQALGRLPFVEALYVLNEHGIQVTETLQQHPAVSSALYRPAAKGADLSLKPYFLMLQAGLDRFTTDPYISGASGVFCTTMSRHFVNVLGMSYVLCCDLNVPRDSLG